MCLSTEESCQYQWACGGGECRCRLFYEDYSATVAASLLADLETGDEPELNNC